MTILGNENFDDEFYQATLIKGRESFKEHFQCELSDDMIDRIVSNFIKGEVQEVIDFDIECTETNIDLYTNKYLEAAFHLLAYLSLSNELSLSDPSDSIDEILKVDMDEFEILLLHTINLISELVKEKMSTFMEIPENSPRYRQ